jgi:NADH-quinone oxidoreductase subunit M
MSSSIFMFLSIQIIYLIGLFMLMVIPKYNTLLLKKASLTVSYILLFIIILMGVRINAFELTLAPLSLDFGWINTGLANFNYSISIDSLSYVFMLLSALLIPLCIISSWNNIKFNLKDFFIILITVE